MRMILIRIWTRQFYTIARSLSIRISTYFAFISFWYYHSTFCAAPLSADSKGAPQKILSPRARVSLLAERRNSCRREPDTGWVKEPQSQLTARLFYAYGFLNANEGRNANDNHSHLATLAVRGLPAPPAVSRTFFIFFY